MAAQNRGNVYAEIVFGYRIGRECQVDHPKQVLLRSNVNNVMLKWCMQMIGMCKLGDKITSLDLTIINLVMDPPNYCTCTLKM